MSAPRVAVAALFVRAIVVASVLGAVGLSAVSAEAAQYKKKETTVAQAPSSPTSGDGETATGTLSSSAAPLGKDCFVARKRAFVPGTGYIIRKSTFCN